MSNATSSPGAGAGHLPAVSSQTAPAGRKARRRLLLPVRECEVCRDAFIPEVPHRRRCFICAPRFVDLAGHAR